MSPFLGFIVPRTFGASNMPRLRRYRSGTLKYKLLSRPIITITKSTYQRILITAL